MELLGNWQRSCYCGEPRPAQVGQELIVMGWVHARRDHGGVTFIDLRDRSGMVQIVFNPQVNETAHAAAHTAGDALPGRLIRKLSALGLA